MGQEPDQLRYGIEQTRASLTDDVDRLSGKTSPKRAAQRRWAAVKEKVMGTSEHARHAGGDTASSAMGTVQEKASQVGDKAGTAAHEAAGTVRGAPQTVAKQAQGNPIAAGIIAFGAGMLAATLIPVTDAERRAGQQVKDNAGDLTDRVKDAAAGMTDEMSGTVQQAAGQLKETAADAAQATRERAQSSAQEATEQTRQAAQDAR